MYSWKYMAFFLEHPDWIKAAKSPISWGTSFKNIVMVVINPIPWPVKNEAPITRPSVKLWAKSATKFQYPAIAMPFSFFSSTLVSSDFFSFVYFAV